LVGYLPERGDFETEYDNDAEQILADMEFKEEDTKWETGNIISNNMFFVAVIY
jgi:hypothetical protein